MPALSDVITVLDELYDPRLAESWDAVGLVCGDPGADVRRVLLAVDPAPAVAEEAVRWGADLVVAHHPLFLRPVHGVAATTPKGRVLHRLLTGGVALHVAHTNADSADPGVSDALAEALGLTVLAPLDPAPGEARDKLVTIVPRDHVAKVLAAIENAGARPPQAVEGTDSLFQSVEQTRLEVVAPRGRRSAVVQALRAVHPDTSPVIELYELADPPGRCGIGRVCELPSAEPLSAFVARTAARLPATPAGLRVAGDPQRTVRTVAVCGGAGDSLLGAARTAGVDVFLTADLRHHPAGEALDAGGPALVDAAHWATEWPWLSTAAARLTDALAARGTTVETYVSRIVTDPWTAHVPSTGDLR